MKPRCASLAVPGSQPRFHAKADQLAAEEVFLDVEDSVAEGATLTARDEVVHALRTYHFAGKIRTVRVNGCDTNVVLRRHHHDG